LSVQVHKLRVPVRLSHFNHQPRDGYFVLFPHLGGEERPESIYELLNAHRSVIPFFQGDDTNVLLLTRDNIDWVAVSASVEPGVVLPPGFSVMHEERAELRFLDDSRVEAVVQWQDGENVARLSDYLDFCDQFIAARTGFGTLIANKYRIREIRIVTGVALARDVG
jgi:hypothetical protein